MFSEGRGEALSIDEGRGDRTGRTPERVEGSGGTSVLQPAGIERRDRPGDRGRGGS